MKKIICQKLLAWLLAAVMAVSMLPAAVSAADTACKAAIFNRAGGMGTAGTNGVVSDTYYLVDSDGTLEAYGANKGNYNIYYDESADKLTIHNLKMKADGKWLLVPGGTTIEVLGENRIEPAEAGMGGGIAVVQDGNITIAGDGSLYIKSNEAGIHREKAGNVYAGTMTAGGVTINGSVKLTIAHTGADKCIDVNSGDVVIGGNAEVVLNPREGTAKNSRAIALFKGENIIIRDSAKVSASGGFDTNGAVSIEGGVVEITDEDESGMALRGERGIKVAEGAKLTVNSATRYGQAVAGGNTAEIKGDVTINMTNKTPAGSAAIYATSIINISGKLTVIGGTNAVYLDGGGTITIENAEVNISGCKIGCVGKVKITSSLMEISTLKRAFNSEVNADGLTDDYEVWSGASAADAVRCSAHEPGTWMKAYTKIIYAPKINAAPAEVVFDPLSIGYENPPEARTVTITNTGKTDISKLSIALGDGGDAFFTLDTAGLAAPLGVGGKTAFTVQPKLELNIGTYDTVILADYGGADKRQIPVSITVIPQKPVFTASDESSGILSNVTTSMKYSVDGGMTWKDVTEVPMVITDVSADRDVQVQMPGDAGESFTQKIDISQAQKPSGLSGAACTTVQQNDGRITGVDESMEYKLSTDSDWKPAAGQAVTGLTDGTYDVRVKASGTMLASAVQSVVVGRHSCAEAGDRQADENRHWNVCSCGESIGAEEHTFVWVTDKNPTKTEAGSKHEECTACGYKKAAVEIPIPQEEAPDGSGSSSGTSGSGGNTGSNGSGTSGSGGSTGTGSSSGTTGTGGSSGGTSGSGSGTTGTGGSSSGTTGSSGSEISDSSSGGSTGNGSGTTGTGSGSGTSGSGSGTSSSGSSTGSNGSSSGTSGSGGSTGSGTSGSGTTGGSGGNSPAEPPASTAQPEKMVSSAEVKANSLKLETGTYAGWNKNSFTVSWGRTDSAQGYDIFAVQCGKKMNAKSLVKTVKGQKTSVSLAKIGGKKISGSKNYKVKIKAYKIINGKKTYIGSSRIYHTAGKNDKSYTNAKSIKAAKKTITLRAGKSGQINAEIVKQSAKKKLLSEKHGPALYYYSTDTKTAAVTKNGKIKAKNKGSCYIYVKALNGISTRVKVNVK